MTTSEVAYNSNDATQQSFLSALALGETGNSAFASNEGVGGVDLTGLSTDSYGFPQWSGEGNSHAAGTYQFQPSTWDSIASQYNLNFQNPSDQNAGAWYEAQQTFSNVTGGQSLETALQNGEYQEVQSALQGVWPSVTGNQAAPQGLSGSLASGTGSANINPPNSATATSGDTGSTDGEAASGLSGWIADIENFFVRFGLIIIGGIVVIVALWILLSREGYVPSPSDTVKAVVKAA